MLDDRTLNRSLLARQGLLERSRSDSAEAMVERLVGLQAQVPGTPYVALWSRLEAFDPHAFSASIEARRMVRAGLLRGTIHLVSARDCRAIEPLTRPVFAKAFKSPFGKGLHGAPLDDVIAAGRELLAAAPRTRTELSAALAEHWPAADPVSLGQAVVHHLPVVQVTPRGLWRRGGQAGWALTEGWLGAAVDPEPSVETLVRRYLAAFGPAAVSDARTWSRLTGLREVFERLRPELVTFADERGRELFDLPGMPFPDPATPAPPRFLPQFDNVLLSHEDREQRMLHPTGPNPFPTGPMVGTLLVDGFVRAVWRIDGGALTIEGFRALPEDPSGTAEAIEAEGEALLAFVGS